MLLKSHIGKLLFVGAATIIWLISLVGLILLIGNRNTFREGFFGIALFIIGLSLIMIPFAALNWLVRKKIYKQREPFAIFSGIRNVDSMYIGEILIEGGGGITRRFPYTPLGQRALPFTRC